MDLFERKIALVRRVSAGKVMVYRRMVMVMVMVSLAISPVYHAMVIPAFVTMVIPPVKRR